MSDPIAASNENAARDELNELACKTVEDALSALL